MQRTLSIAIVATLLLLGACSSSPTKSPSHSQVNVANTKCPVSGEALDGKGPTIFYNQATIGFCCENCVAKFAKLDGAAKQAKLDAAK